MMKIMSMRCAAFGGTLLFTAGLFSPSAYTDSAAAGTDLVDEARASMARAAIFFESRLGVEGSYVWEYNLADSGRRRGEGEVTLTQGWVQSPGTPAIGEAFVRAYAVDRSLVFKEAALRSALALVRTQLLSGGWWYRIEFDPDARRSWCYRVDPEPCAKSGLNPYRNATTLDDNTTQGALVFLMLVDDLFKGANEAVHSAVRYGLNNLVAAQYSNGAWPVRLDRPEAFGALPAHAKIPAEWQRTYPLIHGSRLVLGDHVIRDTIRMFLLAHKLYNNPAYLQAAERAGKFLIVTRLPEPQAGWAQAYDVTLAPVWGRKFEPPAVTSWETAGSIEALLELFLYTGDQRYLEPLSAAAEWLEAAQRRDGLWSRFYELRTNRPLYVNREYALTYSSHGLPRHYGFLGTFDIPRVLNMYHRVLREGRDPCLMQATRQISEEERRIALASMAEIAMDVRSRIGKDGSWAHDGKIKSADFVTNMSALAEFVALSQETPSREWQRLQALGLRMDTLSLCYSLTSQPKLGVWQP